MTTHPPRPNPHPATLTQALAIIGQHLEPLLIRIVEQAVIKALAQTRGPATTATADENTKLTLKQTRVILRCTPQVIIDAIRTGDLPAKRIPIGNRAIRHFGEGKTIPNFSWRFLQSDVNRFKTKRDLQKAMDSNQ